MAPRRPCASGCWRRCPKCWRRGRGVIAFALPSDESEEPADAEGAIWNARAAAAFYPGWICRFYVGGAVSAQLRERLAALPNAEVAEAPGETDDPQWWGLEAAGDCDALLLRSVRARLTLMEKQAVWHWLASDREIHSLHDHPGHRWELPPAHLAGLRGEALRWMAQHRAQAQGDPLRALVAAMPRAWLQHDNHWGVGAPLPWPRILPRRMYHGMPWDPHPDFAGLPVPAWEPYRRRQRARHSPRFFAAMLARWLLRPLPERAARACMAGLCRLLYGRGVTSPPCPPTTPRPPPPQQAGRRTACARSSASACGATRPDMCWGRWTTPASPQPIYPGWVCRFYVGSCVPAGAVAELQGLPAVEVVEMGKPGDMLGLYWRLEAAKDADILLSRDADCRLSFPEKAAVDAWLESGREAHTFGHFAMQYIPGGAFGMRGEALQDLIGELSLWDKNALYGDDEKMLREKLLPKLRKRGQLVMHEDVWGYGEPFPRPMADGSTLGLTWHPVGLFAQCMIPMRIRDPFLQRTWYRRWGAALCRKVRAVHEPSGLALAWLLWRTLYGPFSPLGRVGRRLWTLWRGLLPVHPDDVQQAISDSLPQVQLPGRGIIAFALDSDDASVLRGALDNARAAAEFFPGWTCRFYAHGSVPDGHCEDLAAVPGAEVVRVAGEDEAGDPQLWGLAAAGDCDVLLLRSPLARLSLLDLQAVLHWLATDKDLHSVHDHPEHRWDRPTPHLLGLRGAARRWAAENAGKAGLEDLEDLAREMPDQWLRHDGQWHLGTPLPSPRLRFRRAHHGMVWECQDDYGGLPLPNWERHVARLRSRRGWKFAATWLARAALRPLPERAAATGMAGLCRLLYGPGTMRGS